MAKNAVRRKPANNKIKTTAARVAKQRKFPHFSRGAWLRVVIFTVFAGVLTVLVSPTLTINPAWPTQTTGYAPRDIISDIEFTTVDLYRTEQARSEAAKSVLPVYSFDAEALRNALLNLGKFLELFEEYRQKPTLTFEEKMTDLMNALRLTDLVKKSDEADRDKISEDIAATWLKSAVSQQSPAGQPTEEQPEQAAGATEERRVAQESAVADYRFDELSQTAKALLQGVLEEGVIAREESQKIAEKPGQEVQIQLVKLRGSEPEKTVSVTDLRKVDDARSEIAKRAKNRYADKAIADAVSRVASQFVTVTLTPDKAETEKRGDEAAARVSPVSITVKPGQGIISKGDQLTAQARRTIEDYRKAREAARKMQQRVRGSVGHTVIVLLLMVGLARSLALIAPSVYSSSRQLTLVLLAITIMVGVAKLVSLGEQFSGYVVPAASVPILLAILIDRRVGLLAAAVVAILVSMVYGNNWNILALVMAGSLAGVLALVSVRKRTDLLRPGAFTTVVSIAVAVALGFVGDTIRWSAEGMASVRDAAINGLLVMLIVPGTLSVFESAFKITTEIQLLELTDLNHPVLRRLTMEAPGTHHHSLMVGNLAEAAADALGANSLLARVCSYYHDIGKLNRPEYFSENQTGYNKHDGLSPVMSSRIIASHVKDGVELARDHGLCQPVIDIIKQHHGTDLIRFFYEKALKDDKHNSVREEDFRYPGPKPESREAAIVMLADAIESASRSLTNLTRARLIAVADKIVNTRFADGQFDNCDLTLKDLHVIAESIVRVLMSAHHMRVEYPELESPNPVRNSKLSSTN
jgi:putative nucleotidyltransferase with HDIG domain